MDWNRRWAKDKMLPNIAGHLAWFNNAKIISKKASKLWVKYLTLWALSKENLIKRDSEELSWIIGLIDKMKFLVSTFNKLWVRIETIWDIESLPEKSRKILSLVKEKTKNNTSLVLTTALVYSWQDEIIRAIKKIQKSGEHIENLSPEIFKKYLDTSFLPPPDLIIRTWWNIRHSWFMLFDSDYSEYYFSNNLWPDFSPEELEIAILNFENSKRNFWK